MRQPGPRSNRPGWVDPARGLQITCTIALTADGRAVKGGTAVLLAVLSQGGQPLFRR